MAFSMHCRITICIMSPKCDVMVISIVTSYIMNQLHTISQSLYTAIVRRMSARAYMFYYLCFKLCKHPTHYHFLPLNFYPYEQCLQNMLVRYTDSIRR